MISENKVQHSLKPFIKDIILMGVFIGFFTFFIRLLNYFFESLTLDDNHVKLKTGIISNHEIVIPYNKINTVSVKQGILGMILNYGNLIIFTGNDVSGIVFKDIDKPVQLRDIIQQKIKA